MRLSLLALLVGWLVWTGCSTPRFVRQEINQTEKDFHDHIGFVLYDPQALKTLVDYHGDRYFIPASNTKIFTLYAGLRLLGDSVPSLRYIDRNDSLIFWGTGDPGFLYEDVSSANKTFSFLKTHPSKLFVSTPHFETSYFGPGWSWDDHNYSYQVERTPFPVYGNRFRVQKSNSTFTIRPSIFNTDVVQETALQSRHEVVRDVSSNELKYYPGIKSNGSEWTIPFHYDDELLGILLADTLKRAVGQVSIPMPRDAEMIYSLPVDSLYKPMMQESDNFIAEQLLILCAGMLGDTLKSEIAIREVKKRFLSDLPDPPVWVDGSGLSRLNLFTPRSIVRMWEKLDSLISRERLLGLVAAGGVSGTLKDYYKTEKPFVFGKTGTLSNNHTLSGFLVTRKGKTLIFSWMNNNFTSTSGDVRRRMESVLKNIYERY